MKKKDPTRVFDEELLALGRIVRIIQAFPDIETQGRLASYIRDRFPDIEVRPSPREVIDDVWKGPRSFTAEERRAFLEERQEALGLEPLDAPSEKAADRIETLLESAHPTVCRHGSLLGAACFGCEAEAIVERTRHSAPPVGGIAD